MALDHELNVTFWTEEIMLSLFIGLVLKKVIGAIGHYWIYNIYMDKYITCMHQYYIINGKGPFIIFIYMKYILGDIKKIKKNKK